ncbi:MAG: methyltransferase type 11 [uncultured bacterium]|nr:MAG: methyltransferase type 11 [uncultured bacterium]HBR71547.1 hypothetical protein [Candidatus Moranbacteria bacterium]
MQKNFDFFNNREGRAAFIAKTFYKEIAESKNVLDVGCDINTLKKIVGEKVTGIDLYGKPDYKVDLEKDGLSIFKDREFDFVVCTEVLEHLEGFYEVLDELVRVSNHFILISLPNCLNIFTQWDMFRYHQAGKFYGLPLEKPMDRHRWFFGYRDIDLFFQHYCKKNNYEIVTKFLHCNYSNTLKGNLVRTTIKVFNIDNASQSYWILISKKI